ncbi:MAG TPA: tRNA (adenosine(37)-N6)-threonylcarbamoyltransferase complex ATPase subunit type 1 TsaE [Burkholderiales bacterium]|nr:tRNA (adenosine(37)-N6)-threonylcarbamoyltransferase complex ATPase subunit type 1 TsaE [Burkholderiales bacterium]
MSAQAANNRSAFLPDEAATLAAGRKLAHIVEPGLFIALSGDLGAGKTTLTRGVLRGLGYEGKVKSPTYTLVELYNLSKLDLYHFDFYRFNDPREWQESGFRDIFGARNACVVEWPERVPELLPRADLRIALETQGDGRNMRIVAETEFGSRCLLRLPD